MIYLPELRFQEQVFRSAAMGLVVTDLHGIITQVNAAAERLTGWLASELIAQSIDQLRAPGCEPILPPDLLTERSRTGRAVLRRKDGSALPVDLVANVVIDELDEPLALVVLLSDASQDERQRSRLTELITAGAALCAEPDPDLLPERICQDACRILDMEAAYLATLEDSSDQLVGLAAVGVSPTDWRGARVRLDADGALSVAVREKRTVIRTGLTIEAMQRELGGGGQGGTLLAVPLLVGEQVEAVLALTDTRPRELSAEESRLARGFAELAAVAWQSARLHQAERVKSERLLGLIQVGQLLTSSLERDAVFEAVVDGAQRLLGVDEVRIWLLERPDGPFRLAYLRTARGTVAPPDLSERLAPDRDPALPPAVIERHHSPLGRALQIGRPWQITDIDADETWSDKRYARRHGLTSSLIVPLSAQGRPLGGLTLASKQPRKFEAEEIEVAVAFAQHAAIAVQNAETLARQRQARHLQHILEQPLGQPAEDRVHIDHLLSAAERLIELATNRGP